MVTATVMDVTSPPRQITDGAGRRLVLRQITALDKLRLLKAAGPELSFNQPWLSLALMASSVSAIDDVPVPFPANETQIESLVSRLGDTGLDAIANAFDMDLTRHEANVTASAGNLSGTPN